MSSLSTSTNTSNNNTSNSIYWCHECQLQVDVIDKKVNNDSNDDSSNDNTNASTVDINKRTDNSDNMDNDSDAVYLCKLCNSNFIEEIDNENDPRNFVQINTSNTNNNTSFTSTSSTTNSIPSTSQSIPSVTINSFQLPGSAINIIFSRLFPQRGDNNLRTVNINYHDAYVGVDNNNQQNLHPMMAMMSRVLNTNNNAPNGQNSNGFNFFNFFGNQANIGLPQPGFVQGDYAFGDIQNLLNQLMAQDTSRSNPVTNDARSTIDDLKLDNDTLPSFTSSCGVCQDEFKVDDIVNTLLCRHYYHKECLTPWFETRCTCPICRFNINTNKPAN